MGSEPFFGLFVVVYDKNWFYENPDFSPQLSGIRGNGNISDDFEKISVYNDNILPEKQEFRKQISNFN
jgi:hypothetical protein